MCALSVLLKVSLVTACMQMTPASGAVVSTAVQSQQGGSLQSQQGAVQSQSSSVQSLKVATLQSQQGSALQSQQGDSFQAQQGAALQPQSDSLQSQQGALQAQSSSVQSQQGAALQPQSGSLQSEQKATLQSQSSEAQQSSLQSQEKQPPSSNQLARAPPTTPDTVTSNLLTIQNQTPNQNPIPSADPAYLQHLKLFRSSKASTFNGWSRQNSLPPIVERPQDISKQEERVRTFAAGKSFVLTPAVPEAQATSSTATSTTSQKTIQDEKDDAALFEALRVEQTDICSSCPPLWMNATLDMKSQCSNYESVSTFFEMSIDGRSAQKIDDSSSIKQCTRTITCPQPHMLVKWHDSELCDVHAPSVTDERTFTYKCNGTHWTMHGFPLTSVICGVSSRV
ncbi:unnamed protein product [Caenorhabditis auriculariae]|uniref:Uncharacterized protein n=1 Tax=Caenorhabditis auriculariae TaxID=2777116 RepID=A0A8S1H4K9_9PELO|nr:unnamed protein product [Caenorhabditis auriculariae]